MRISDWSSDVCSSDLLAVSKGVKIVYLDNLTALIDTNNERASVETIVKEISLLAQELGIIIIVVSHLAPPEGKHHEDGGRVMLQHFKGSRAIRSEEYTSELQSLMRRSYVVFCTY